MPSDRGAAVYNPLPEPIVPSVETQAISRRFKDVLAVDSVDLAVAEGEVFGLLGPNGAGKTTLIKLLTTLLIPTSGEAYINGYSIHRQQGSVRRSVGYVPQMVSADGALSGYENLLIFAKLYDIPPREVRERVEQALAFMGLSEVSRNLVRTFSGGMIRRLEIAQAFIHRPRVLFLDEPTVGLDPGARRAVWEHITALREQYGITIFLTTHLMEEADSLCQRVAIMHRGRVVALDTPTALKASLETEGATLDDVFIHYAGGSLAAAGGGSYRETRRARRTARRLG
jgi:ABC-2 type transport system ATP-binding protein